MTLPEPQPGAVAAIWSRVAAPLASVGVMTYRNAAPLPIEGSGTVYVVISAGRQSRPAGIYHQSLLRPTVALTIFADCSRDPQGLPLALNAQSRADAVFEYLLPRLTVPVAQWPEHATHGILSCDLDDAQAWEVPDSDAAMLATRWHVDVNHAAPMVVTS